MGVGKSKCTLLDIEDPTQCDSEIAKKVTLYKQHSDLPEYQKIKLVSYASGQKMVYCYDVIELDDFLKENPNYTESSWPQCRLSEEARQRIAVQASCAKQLKVTKKQLKQQLPKQPQQELSMFRS